MADPDSTGSDLEPLQLVCVAEELSSEVAEPCQRGEDCPRDICLLTGTCSIPCSEDDDCGSDGRCADSYARTGDAALQPVRACVSIAVLPAGGEARSEVLDDFLPGSGSVWLELPSGGSTTLYVLEHLGDEAWPAFTPCRSPLCPNLLRTLDPDPVVLFDAALYAQQWRGDEQPPLNPIAVGTRLVAHESHPAAFLLPNGPRAVLSEAGYEVELETDKPGSLRRTVLNNEEPGGTLDLNVFYVGGLDWEPAGHRGPPLLEEALHYVEEIYQQAGIGIGEVHQFEIAGGLRERLQIIRERYAVLEALPELLALSAGAEAPAVNLFFVKQIADTLAISGSTPGPLGLQGTGASGIAFSTDSIDEAAILGKVIAHEIGHHLGLFHTTEMDGTVLDPLPDTPECRNERDEDGNGILTVQECLGFGADNLMFWSQDGDTAITEDQAAALRSAPILR